MSHEDRETWELFNAREWPFGETMRALMREGICHIEYEDGTVVSRADPARFKGVQGTWIVTNDLEIPLEGSSSFSLTIEVEGEFAPEKFQPPASVPFQKGVARVLATGTSRKEVDGTTFIFTAKKGVSRTIPEITDERLNELIDTLKPVMKTEQGYSAIKTPHPSKVAFTWSPNLVGRKLRKLEEVGEATSYHDWAYHGFFKPSLKEVYACVQDCIPEGATHFWLDSSRLQEPGEAFLHESDTQNISGYHRARIVFLSGEKK